MKAVTTITFTDDESVKFFGEGPCRLLRAIEQTGSMRSAAMSMNMAYSKAARILKHAEEVLGFALTVRTIGGSDGGGSRLTAEGREWLEKYENYRDACAAANKRLLAESGFCNTGDRRPDCIIMASGEGKRFGGNKLMAGLDGRPVISYVIEAVSGLFRRVIVVTRHADVEAYCKGIRNAPEVILHDKPGRNDTVRLGIEALADSGSCGCLICQGDQPFIGRELIETMSLCGQTDNTHIRRACFGEKVGTPVFFPARYFEELKNLPEGSGGSIVIKRHAESVRCMPVRYEYELMDIDTREDLEKALKYVKSDCNTHFCLL